MWRCVSNAARSAQPMPMLLISFTAAKVGHKLREAMQEAAVQYGPRHSLPSHKSGPAADMETYVLLRAHGK